MRDAINTAKSTIANNYALRMLLLNVLPIISIIPSLTALNEALESTDNNSAHTLSMTSEAFVIASALAHFYCFNRMTKSKLTIEYEPNSGDYYIGNNIDPANRPANWESFSWHLNTYFLFTRTMLPLIAVIINSGLSLCAKTSTKVHLISYAAALLITLPSTWKEHKFAQFENTYYHGPAIT